MASHNTGPKMRLGGVVHAARGLWAVGKSYAVGAFCPAYLVEAARNYLIKHGCTEFILIGEVTGAPNVITIADVNEIGFQGYEDILRDEKKIVLRNDVVGLDQFSDVVIFPGRYPLDRVFRLLNPESHVTIDIAYDIDDLSAILDLNNRIDFLVISTSSKFFVKVASDDIEPLLNLAENINAKYLLVKENRGGSRLFDIRKNEIEYVTASLGTTKNSVGVGDVFTAVFGTFNGNARDAAWRAMQVATVYSQTTWPDDLQRDVRREFQIPIEIVRSLGGSSLPWHSRQNLPIYLAAPDFSYKNHKEIARAIDALNYHNFLLRRPVKENGEIPQNSSPNDLLAYYYMDLNLLKKCVLVFAIPIERDPGTLVEVGFAIGLGKPVVTFDPRCENENTMVISGSVSYSSNLDICLNATFEALTEIDRKSRE